MRSTISFKGSGFRLEPRGQDLDLLFNVQDIPEVWLLRRRIAHKRAQREIEVQITAQAMARQTKNGVGGVAPSDIAPRTALSMMLAKYGSVSVSSPSKHSMGKIKNGQAKGVR